MLLIDYNLYRNYDSSNHQWSFSIIISFFTGAEHLLSLPTDPLLVRSTPTLPSLGDLGSWFKLPSSDNPKASTSVVAEGIPPLPSKLIERIQRWEFIDLASLLSSDQPPDDVMTMAPSGQLLLVASERQPRQKRTILDVHSWAQAFSIYAAVLSTADSTSKEENG